MQVYITHGVLDLYRMITCTIELTITFMFQY